MVYFVKYCFNRLVTHATVSLKMCPCNLFLWAANFPIKPVVAWKPTKASPRQPLFAINIYIFFHVLGQK